MESYGLASILQPILEKENATVNVDNTVRNSVAYFLVLFCIELGRLFILTNYIKIKKAKIHIVVSL